MMLKKYKQLLIGILIGILIAAVPVGAAVQEYILKQSECKIVVDGEIVKGELPLLIMDPGYNYLPAAEFRSICDKMGIGFEFDPPTKEIRIDTKKNRMQEVQNGLEGDMLSEVTVPINKYAHPDFSEVPPDQRPEIETDGEYYFFTYNGIKYIFVSVMYNMSQPKMPESYRLECPIIDGKFSFGLQLIKYDKSGRKVIIDDIPYAWYREAADYCIPYDYFTNTIMPIIIRG